MADSRESALAYMEACIGDVGRATSRERKEAFVDSVGDFVTTAERHGVEFVRAGEYPDYYPELPGGRIGRAVEVKPLDSKVLGDWYKTLRLTAPLPIMTDDVWLIQRAWSTRAREGGAVHHLGGAVRGPRLPARRPASLAARRSVTQAHLARQATCPSDC